MIKNLLYVVCDAVNSIQPILASFLLCFFDCWTHFLKKVVWRSLRYPRVDCLVTNLLLAVVVSICLSSSPKKSLCWWFSWTYRFISFKADRTLSTSSRLSLCALVFSVSVHHPSKLGETSIVQIPKWFQNKRREEYASIDCRLAYALLVCSSIQVDLAFKGLREIDCHNRKSMENQVARAIVRKFQVSTCGDGPRWKVFIYGNQWLQRFSFLLCLWSSWRTRAYQGSHAN